MDDPNKTTRIVATVAGIAIGLLAAIVVVFIGIQSWNLSTIVYSATAAAIIVGGLVVTLLNAYFDNRPPSEDD